MEPGVSALLLLRLDPMGFWVSLEKELMALYFLGEDRLRELGLVPDPELVSAWYETYARMALVEGGQDGPHAYSQSAARAVIVKWLLQKTRALEVEQIGGRTFYRLRDADEWRRGCAELLNEMLRDESKVTELQALANLEPALRAELRQRVERAGLPRELRLAPPKLEPVRDASGELIDVRLEVATEAEQGR
jgi:dipeptidyl-peptidase-3